ncbi:MAG: DUF1127 domain-containing protein [Rhodospirillales bacterium]|jgi:uncharacterized protein YjiS (DUF1127 family)|nr:DUF1127 domain-containing protein [Rhodospirillales bacterium]
MNRVATFSLASPTPGIAVAGAIQRGWQSTQEFLIRATDLLGELEERARQRRQLATLSDRMLSDIGRDRGQAIAESMKPFWRR